ncbi:MAG: class B sortase [Bacilli bacterium]|nr:class B sortase [Bacilli bacterium]
MKKIGKFLKYLYYKTHKGFYFLCLVFSRGFYYYFYLFFSFLKKIFKKSKKLEDIVNHYKERQERPEYFFLLLFATILFISTIYVIFYDSNKVVNLKEMEQEKEEVIQEDSVQEKVEEEKEEEKKPPLETNLYKIYGNKSIHEINFNELRSVNSDVKAWIIVDGTNINYPVVQTSNNDYYLKYNIKKKKTTNGWPFIDYRNSSSMSDDNTIFYGHNLLNKTAFGSISNLFTKSWLNNSSHKILVLTDTKMYEYEIFSVYYSDPNSYYLQTKFSSPASKLNFFNNLKVKSKVKLPATVSENDKIITLSTCTDDNKGRKVVHAKLVSISNR